jgi:hypothetical protein
MKPFALMATELYNNLFDGILGAESITGTMTMIILNFIFFSGVYGKFVAVTLGQSCARKIKEHVMDLVFFGSSFGFFTLQIPVAVGVSSYEAVSLYKGTRKIASKGETGTNWRAHQLVLYCACGVLAGIVGGLLGLGGGFILGPLFLELGIPPQVHSIRFF